MTLDIENAFDSHKHLFLNTELERYGFKEDFIKWIQMDTIYLSCKMKILMALIF